MSSVWLEGAKVNSVLYRSFVVKGRNRVVAAILFAEDGNLYLTFSRSVAGVVKELVLPSPFINQNKRMTLRFSVGSRQVASVGYLVTAGSKYNLDLLCEELRFIMEASLGIRLKIRKHKSPDSPPRKELKEEERKLFELAPIDLPSDLLSVESGEGVEVSVEGDESQ